MEFRGAEGKTDRYPTLVNELVQLKVAVLIVPTLPSVLIAKEATKTIPIVMISNRDPVVTGIVDSLARPGGNITGLPGYNVAQVVLADLGLPAPWAPLPLVERFATL